jgi:fatty-acyl-CoA synthase
MNIKPEDKMCIQPPLFHTFGCSACAILAVYNGCGMVIMDKYRPKATLKQIEKEKCTIASGVPTMFVGFLKEYQSHKYDISSLRTGIIAGSAAPKGLIKDVIEKMGIEGLISSYGMTEASPAVTATNYDDSTYYKSESTGYPLPGVEIKIVDEHTGETKPRGKEGEIHVRGATVTKGYYKMPDETARAIDADGWLHTGDVGFIRDNGYLTITCRIKDIIIRSGENINPAEIEDFISSHEEVEEIYAVGVPDDVYGEEVMAFIKLREGSVMTESEIRNFCKGKIATNKIPKYIIFVDQYPVTDTGKVSKAKLKELALKML